MCPSSSDGDGAAKRRAKPVPPTETPPLSPAEDGPPAPAAHVGNPTHTRQVPWFERAQLLLQSRWRNDADDNRVRPIPMHREVLVPAELLPVDGLIDLRGWALKGGLLHLLQPWCRDRLVCMDWTSGDVSLAKLDTMMSKATMVGAGRRQGDAKWSAREPGVPVTLMIVGDHARPQWFTTWGLNFCEKMTGVWVLETDLLTVVVVRPRHLATLRGGSLWGLLPNHLCPRNAFNAMQTLLGDPRTATIYHEAAKQVLKHRFPEQTVMTHTNPHDTVAESETSPQVQYVWQQIARMAEQTFEAKKQADKERADKEKVRLQAEARIAAETARAEAEAQRAEAEAQRAEALAAEAAFARTEAETAKAEIARLQALLDKR